MAARLPLFRPMASPAAHSTRDAGEHSNGGNPLRHHIVSICRQLHSGKCRPVTRMTTVRQRPDGPKKSLDISFISRQTRSLSRCVCIFRDSVPIFEPKEANTPHNTPTNAQIRQIHSSFVFQVQTRTKFAYRDSIRIKISRDSGELTKRPIHLAPKMAIDLIENQQAPALFRPIRHRNNIFRSRDA